MVTAHRRVIIEAAVNGVTRKRLNANVPYHPDEIAAEITGAARAGAAVAHFHVRDPETHRWTNRTDLYAEVFRRVRRESDVLLWPTFGPGDDPVERYSHIVELAADEATRPDFTIVDPGSVNLIAYDPVARRVTGDGGVYANPYSVNRYFLETTRDLGIKPTLQVFDGSFLRAIRVFLDEGLLTEPIVLKLYFGGAEMPFGLAPNIASLQAYLEMLDGVSCQWFAACLGGDVFPLAAAAIHLGGHVRVGLEDHHYAEQGAPANAVLVERAVAMVEAAGLSVADVDRSREMLGL